MNKCKKSDTKEIAKFVGLEYKGDNILIDNVSSSINVKKGTLFFTFDNFFKSDKEALVICKENAVIESTSLSVIRHSNPRFIFAKITTEYLFIKQDHYVHEFAIIDPHAQISEKVGVGPFTIIESGVKIGKNSVIGSNVTIKSGTQIGDNTVIKSGVTIGDQGFGFAFSIDGEPKRINHSGGVIIGDHVEVGSNNVICSGTIEPTTIENHVKLDDLVFIAHNCHIGSMTMIASGAVLCGSVSVGEKSWIGPNSTIIDGKKVGIKVKIGLGAVITKDIPDGSKMMGFNALPLKKLAKVKKYFFKT